MLPINPSQIPGIYADALKLQNAGKYDDALKKYSVILNINPKIAEVHFQVGRIFLTGQRYDKAVEHLKTAAGLKPGESAIWAAYSDAVTELSDDKETAECLAKARAARLPAQVLISLQDKLNPKIARSRTSIGSVRKDEIEPLLALMNSGDFSKAETSALTLQRKHPKVALIADILANAQARLNKTEDAIANFKKAIALDPNYAEAHNNYGGLLLKIGKPDEAMVEVRKALKIIPGLPLAHHNLGAIFARLGQRDEAIKRWKKALSLQPKAPETLRMLGSALSGEKKYFEAEEALLSTVKQNDRDAEAFTLLGQAQAAINKEDEARQNFTRALELNPKSSLANNRMAIFLQTIGEFDEAELFFRKSIELDPGNGDNYRVMVASYKLTPDDPLIQVMINQFDDPKTSDVDRRHFGFALSKVMEDTKNHSQVFKYLNTANALMRNDFPYDISMRKKEVSGVKAFFDGLDIPAQNIADTSDYAPIFVTGMPRSGTTLVEQIISSHSTVSGAGEVGYSAREAHKLMMKTNGEYKTFSELAQSDIAKLGHDYESFMRKGFPGAQRVSDKSIQTYTFMGLVKLALPKSRMIVVRRDPRDNLLSVYKNLFTEGTHLYSYNLSDLGAYYKMFLELIAFWQERIPDWFYVVDYEKLVANTEEESRKLIAACGLEWEDQCLDFHKNTRRVDTLSVFQVRQPIYSSSLKAWQRYEDELQELFTALE